MLHQTGAAEDDVLPEGSKELFMKCLRGESRILFNRCQPMSPFLGRPSTRTPSTSSISALIAKDRHIVTTQFRVRSSNFGAKE